MQLSAYYNVVKPTGAADWQLQAQCATPALNVTRRIKTPEMMHG